MRKGTISWVALIVAIPLLSPRLGWGWFDTGHKIVAMIAWEDLSPKTRTAVNEVLKQHPRYEKDLLANAAADAPADELARHVFAACAVWPDVVRGQSHPMHAVYNHAPWHYIDLPFEDGAQAAADPTTAASGPRNIVEALAQCTKELKDAETAADKKAIDICWIAHLIGDIHQPLHTVSHYSAQFPKGDNGGNLAAVLRDPPFADSKANLHFVWDSLPGDFKSETLDRYLARGLRADPKFTRENMKSNLSVTDFMAWAQESNALAVEYAYQNGHLNVGLAYRRGATMPTSQPTPGLPPGYLEKAEQVAIRQITLAGYRLADLLNSTFDPKP